MTTPLKLTLSALVAFLILAFLYFFFDVHIMVHRLFSSNIREEVVRPHRGRILASDGTPLAESERRYNVYMDCCVVKDEKVWADESRALKSTKSPIAGKSGTARQILPKGEQSKDPYSDSQGRHQYAATFAGFFPADAPEYSFVCAIFTGTTAKPAYWDDVAVRAVGELLKD